MHKAIHVTGVMIIALSAGVALAGWPATVKVVQVEKGRSVTVAGSLEEGKPLASLEWAARSTVACFPATQNLKFQGSHVLYAMALPPRSIMTITLNPDSASADLSLYAYSIGPDKFTVVPDLSSCVSCEADHRWDRPKKGKTQGPERSVKLNAATNSYNVVVGVTGPAGASGGFRLTVTLQ